MSSSNKKNKKQKFRPVAIEEILPNAIVRPATSSWADEVENELHEYSIQKISNINLPTAPRAACDLIIDDSKIPPDGPFVAYLSNLPYEISEDDIEQQFKNLKISNIKLPKDDRADRMKGFGYVEFQDKSNLILALREVEVQIKGRIVRISLPIDEEQNRDRGGRSGGMSFSRNRDSGRDDNTERQWRAAAPVPYDPEKSGNSRQSNFARPLNRDRDGGGGYRSGDFKSNFQPAEPTSYRGFKDDRPSDRGGNRMFNRRDDRMGRDRDRDDRMSRPPFGRKFEPRDDREMRRDDREMRRDDREMRKEPPRENTEREEPKQRPRIEIQPRSLPLDANRAPESLPSSIFGGAKPVDTAKREMEIEAKMQMVHSTTVSQGPTPPARTPTSNLSRSSSVSSISLKHREPADSLSCETTAAEESNCSPPVEEDVAELVKPKPPVNAWKLGPPHINAPSSTEKIQSAPHSSTVMDNSAAIESFRECNSLNSPSTVHEDVTVTTVAAVCSGTEIEDDPPSSSAPKLGSTRIAGSSDETRDSNKWTTYSQESFDNNSSSYSGSGFGGGNNRYRDSGRDNRDNRKGERREPYRDDDRRGSYRGGGGYRSRDDGNDYNSSRKWNLPREGSATNGSYRAGNRNNEGVSGGGPRNSGRHDRDRENCGPPSNNFRDKNEKPYNYRAFGSSHSARSEGGEFGSRSGGVANRDRDLAGRRRYENHSRGNQYQDEIRLNESESNNTTASGRAAATSFADPPMQLDSNDSRLKADAASFTNPATKIMENGGGSAESMPDVSDIEDSAKNSLSAAENTAATNSEQEQIMNDSDEFRTRKKQKKKLIEETAERDSKPTTYETEKKNRSCKDDKKIYDNYQTNDKTNSIKNNSKGKEAAKIARKSRGQRDDMPKQKEEPTKDFQDKNRFDFLNDDDN